MTSKKRRRLDPPSIHPRNKYSEKPPDFSLLASLYPSFEPYVFFSSRTGRPWIDWTDFNATRELTRVLLHHDHGVNWWIPDGQLCPTVPNRSNYIHWIEDLLSSELIPAHDGSVGKAKGFDIGTGANCIYPLLGASLLRWRFVGSDVTEVALTWARENVGSNPHISELIEIRNANDPFCSSGMPSSDQPIAENAIEIRNANDPLCSSGTMPSSNQPIAENAIEIRNANVQLCSSGTMSSSDQPITENASELTVLEQPESLVQDHQGGCYQGPPILAGVVREGEYFDFCMCNPPFFESMNEAGLNPRTSCGGTADEMVCHGGERAFITRIIEDSVLLKHAFRWFTSMVGRKANLKFLISKLREVGVSIVKTTEFVQGQTCRWGLAWSFISPRKKLIASDAPGKNKLSFTLEGLPRQFGAFQILKSVESFFLSDGANCKSDLSSFSVNVTLSSEKCNMIPRENLNGSENMQCPNKELSFCISVFEQIPGTLLVRGALLHKESSLSGIFSSMFLQLEEALKKEFLNKNHRS